MKKLIAMLMVCGFAFAVVACGGKKEEAATEDSTAVETPVTPVDTTATDTTATDTTAAQ
jgi:hypothetical protein